MGEKLTKRNAAEVSQSLSFSPSQSTLIGDDTLNDNEKLWKYIRDKRNCSNKQNLLELLSQELQRPNFDVHLESCKYDKPQTGNVKDSKKKTEEFIEESNEIIGSAKNSDSSHKVELCIESNKTILSPSKRHHRSFTKSKNLGKRVLLKEFEKTTTQNKQFKPKCNSTPICKNNGPNRLENNCSSDFDGLSPIIETDSVDAKVNKEEENFELRKKQRSNRTTNNKCNGHFLDQDFTLIPNTQDQLNENDLDNNPNKEITIVIPETQENLHDNEEVLRNNGGEEFLGNNSKSKSNCGFGKSCYTEKSMDISLPKKNKSKRNIDELAEALMKCQQEISAMHNKFEKTKNLNNYTENILNSQEKNENFNISPKRMGNISGNELRIPSKQRRTYTVEQNVLEDSIVLNNDNCYDGHNEINEIVTKNNKVQREALMEINNLSIKCLGNIKKLNELSSRSQNGRQFNEIIHETPNLNQKEISRGNVNRVSRIPQIKRLGILASLKPPTPSKVYEYNNLKELDLPKISSVKSSANNNSFICKTSENHTANDPNSSRVKLIFEQIQKSIPMSPVVIMIDNHSDRNNETNKSNSDSVREKLEKLPPPPPEFSDSYKTKKLRVKVKKLHIPLSKKRTQKNYQSKVDNIDDIMTSDDETNNNGFHSNTKELEVKSNDKCFFNKKNAALGKRKGTAKQRSHAVTKSHSSSVILDKETLRTSKSFTDMHFSSKSKSKIFIPENFSVQPMDLRKRKSRKSSMLASFKINEQSKMGLGRRNLSYENYNSLCQEYRNKCNNFVLEQRKSSNVPEDEKTNNFYNIQKRHVVPFAKIFPENSAYQSFTDIINEARKKSVQTKEKPASHLTEAFSLSGVKNNNNLSEKHKEHHSECFILRDGDQHNLKNISFPAPPSFLLRKEADSTLNIDEEQHNLKSLSFPAPPSFLLEKEADSTVEIAEIENIIVEQRINSNKNGNCNRLSRHYKFQLANEKNKCRKRSISVPVLQNFENQNRIGTFQPRSEHGDHIQKKNSTSSQEFPLFQAVVSPKPDEVIIDIPPMQNISDYVSDFLKNNIETQQNNSSSSSNASSKQKSFKRLQNEIFLRDEVEASSNKSENFIDEHQRKSESDHVYDQPQVVQNLWIKSIKKSEKVAKNSKVKSGAKNKKNKQNMDPLKITYLNLTSNLNSVSSNLSLNQTTDVSRRRLYDKGEELNMELLNNKTTDQNDNIKLSFNNIKQKNVREKKKSNLSNIIFNNITSSSENSEEDFVFKKPTLPVPKAKLNSNLKKTKPNKISEKNNESTNKLEVAKNSKEQPETKDKKNLEVDRLLQSMPKKYKELVNLSTNESVTSEIRRSSRKAVPRRVYTYWANKYENVPCLNEYNKILKEIYKSDVKQQQVSSKKAKKRKSKEFDIADNKKKVQSNISNNKKKMNQTEKIEKKKKKVQKKAEINQTNFENTDGHVMFPECVTRNELQHSNNVSEKQNAKSNKIKEINKNKNRIEFNTGTLNKTGSQSQSKVESITKIVHTLKESFTNFETSVRATVSNTRTKDIDQNKDQVRLQNKQNIKKKSSMKSRKKLESQNETTSNQKELSQKPINSEDISDKSKDIDIQNTRIGTKSYTGSTSDNNSTVTVSDNLSKPSDIVSNYSPGEDFFHWIKRLISVNNDENNLELINNDNNSSQKNNNNHGFERFFAENTFRMVDINQTQFSEKDGVSYIFYNEIMSRNMGFIKFIPGSKKPKAKSKAYNLHFLLLFGTLEFYNEGEAHQSTAGSLIFVPKGSSYRIINNSKDVACLFFIKIMDAEIKI